MARHTFLLKPRWSDLDAYGHVNNVTWLEYLQEARVDMLFVHGPEGGSETLAQGVLVVRAEIDYRRPLLFRQQPYPVHLWVSRLTAASFEISYEISDEAAAGIADAGRVVYGRAKSLQAPVDLASGAPRRLTPREREQLVIFLA